MADNWLPFIKRRLQHITPRDRDVRRPRGLLPLGLYAAYALLFVTLLGMARWLLPA